MFNGDYISIDTILENILRDTDYYNEIERADAIEWAARAIGLIGAPFGDEEIIGTMTVENYRATLPSGIKSIVGIRDDETKIPLIATSDEYIIANYDESIAGTAEEDGVDFGDNTVRQSAYRIANGYAFFNIKEGTLEIKYKKFLTDDNGCLLIPNIDRYMMGIEAYIVFKIDHKLYRRGVISKTIRDSSEQEWLWYVSSAHTKVVTPNYDEAEALKNQIQKMRSDPNAHQYGFKYLGLPTVKKF